MIKIKAVDVVRRIRDELYENIKDKSKEELQAFISQKAASADTEAWRQTQKQKQPHSE